MDIPLISTAAKRPQKLSDSPSTIYVISEDDIIASGVINLPELFRMIPGLNVMATSTSDFNVSSRGGNQLLANKLLVLVDGRYVYQELYGMVFWEALTIQLDDIKQIEIVKGPASVLYGANAFSGVINIITKNPKDEEGTTVSVISGDPGVDIRSLTHRARMGNFSYKVSAQYRDLDKWEETDVTTKNFPEGPESSEDMRKYEGHVQYATDSDASVSLSGGKSYGTTEFFPIEYLTVVPINNGVEWYRLKYSDENFMAHFFQNSGLMHFYETSSDIAEYKAKEGELTYRFNIGERNFFTIGGMKRENRSVFAGGTPYEYSGEKEQSGIYAEDELHVDERLSFFMGIRHDRNYLAESNTLNAPSFSSNQTSPRGGLVFHLSERDTLKFSVGKAYRNPSHFENYLNFIETLPKTPEMEALSINDLDFILRGNYNLQPEKIIAYNVGYQASMKNLSLTADLFYNDIDNVIQHRYKEGNMLDATSDMDFWKTYQNVYSIHSYGTELLIEKKFSSSLSGLISYGWLREYRDDSGAQIKTSPEHKIASELRFQAGNGITLNIQGIYTDSTEWEMESFDIDESGIGSGTVLLESKPVIFKVPSYFMVNVKLGVKLGDNMALSLAGLNLFNDRHREFPEIQMPIYDPGTFDEFAALANSKPNNLGRRWLVTVKMNY